jgi:hypothetical protein
MNQSFQGMAAVTTMRRLQSVPGELVLIQADPANTANVVLAIGSEYHGHQLAPGNAFSAELDNLNMVWAGSANTAVSVRITITVLGCGPS